MLACTQPFWVCMVKKYPRVEHEGFGVPGDFGCRLCSSGFRAQGLGFGVEGFGLRFRVEGWRFEAVKTMGFQMSGDFWGS